MEARSTDVYKRARLARDRRFDGEFFVAVVTTGIYCRPICPARLPREENVRYYLSATEAAQAGYRPCLRCRPESAPASAVWAGTDSTVKRALALIQEGYLNTGSVAAMATRLGVGERYLRKLFDARLGVSPQAIAHTQRLHLAQKLLAETALSITEVAFAAGFNSLRRFNSATQQAFSCSPSALRRSDTRQSRAGITLSLALRPPYDWAGVLALFNRHAVAGLDVVDARCWQRTLRTPGGAARVAVTRKNDHALQAEISLTDNRDLMAVVAQLQRIFDLDAHPADIAANLQEDKAIAGLVTAGEGMRSPCFTHPFEACVRAVLGQQISTAAARKHCALIVEAAGEMVSIAGVESRLFPTPESVLALPDELFRMPSRRRETLRTLCERFTGDVPDADQLLDIKGVGPWTVDILAMRGYGDPNRFPVTDLGLIQAGEALGIARASLSSYSEHWQPWRSYAANLLWRSLGNV